MKIILGVTGSVATVLTSKLVRALIEAGHEVRVVATKSSLYFLKQTPLPETESKLLYLDEDEWLEQGYQKGDTVEHIEFRTWADVLLIAPLSANTLAKIAHGMCDNFLCCIARDWTKEKPLALAPAMNTEMWIDPITEQQLSCLRQRFKQIIVVDPIEKTLACKDMGVGAMAKIETIVSEIEKLSI